jgi:type IV secretory pathway VirB2 component (pilin)
MTRLRIIIPAATVERTKLYLVRGAALLLCVLIFPLVAHASPFDSGISSIQTLFTGTIAKAASLIAIVIGGYVFAKDKDFQKYIETSNDAKPIHPLRIKRSNDDVPKGKPGRKPATSVPAPAAIPMANAAVK